MKPEIIEKLDCIVDQYNIDTDFFGRNKHTIKLGYSHKQVTRSDVLTILIKKAFEELPNRSNL